MLLLAFGHKARHGKDTAGESVFNYYEHKRQLALRHGLRVIPSVGLYKFATALYKEVEDAIEHSNGDVTKLINDGFTDFVTGQHIEIPESVHQTIGAQPEPLAKYGKHGQLLQWWGTEFRRKQNSNYWVDRCFEKIDYDRPHIAVITDVRFQNEAEAVRQRNGYVIKVERLTALSDLYIAGDRPATHRSEIDLDNYNFDYYIKAKSGQVAWVEQQAVTLAEMLRGLEG